MTALTAAGPAVRVLCGSCRFPLDPAVAAAGFASHPVCDPAERFCWACRRGPVLCRCARPRYAPRRLAAVPAGPPYAGLITWDETAGEGRCGGCLHKAHRDLCRGKAPSGCMPLADSRTGDTIGIACTRAGSGGSRPGCTCPWGWCHRCKARIAGAAPFPLGSGADEVDLDPASLGRPGGQFAVRLLPDGSLGCRPAGSALPRDGWVPGSAHACASSRGGTG